MLRTLVLPLKGRQIVTYHVIEYRKKNSDDFWEQLEANVADNELQSRIDAWTRRFDTSKYELRTQPMPSLRTRVTAEGFCGTVN